MVQKGITLNVELAKTAGFCFGVKRAVDTVYKQIEKHQSEKIFTYGPIIHNEEVIKDLRSHGVEVLNDEEELKTVDADVVVIRSHGVAKYIYDIMDERGITCVDATCPFVKKIHKIVAEESAKGSYIVIIGNGEHPEVEGIRGWAGEQVTVIQTPEDAERFELPEKEQKVCIVAQTTFNYNKFKELVEIISKKRYDIVVLNTICNATKERQEEYMQVLYKSTRGKGETVTASMAILKGLSEDGGLFVPTSIPKLDVPVEKLAQMTYQETAYEVMSRFLTDFTEEELKAVQGEFTPSQFVKKITGVENVCERSAVLGCGQGTLIRKKTGRDGVTTALAAGNRRIRFE